MGDVWDSFITGFCKVEFACHQGEPNWLGRIFLSVGVSVVVITFVNILEKYI